MSILVDDLLCLTYILILKMLIYCHKTCTENDDDDDDDVV